VTPYAELQVTTNFTFLRGASHAEELATVAAALGIRAIGITDRNGVAGVVRAHLASRATGLRVVVGCRLDLTDAPSLLAWPEDRQGWAELCRLLTVGKRRAPKGECHLAFADVAAHLDRCQIALVPPETALDAAELDATAAVLTRAKDRWGRRLSLVASHLYRGDDARRLHRLAGLAARTGVPLLATNDVHMHTPDRRALADVLTCIREHRTVHTAGYHLAANAERHLKAPDEMARLFRRHPDALARAVAVADACRFSLDELTYEYPEEVTGAGESAQETLERLTWAGACDRYGADVPAKIRTLLRHELDLIERLGYAPYFLTVEDVVRHARARGILCQGRGSAANSAVCYVLGITAVDPARADLLFERFVSDARNEPPDIDVDFEHERREEVIQYIYKKYGRERAGLTATVIRYRARGAIREVGKAMGLTDDVVGRLSGAIWGWGTEAIDGERAAEQGLDPQDPTLARTLDLARELIGFPRHLSQHVGGFVITRGRLDELCPILNAAMADRTTIEWDKDDIDALGILKVDVLALGMLTCVRKGFDLLARHHGTDLTLATVPAEDRAVYDMLCRADSLGVFQVESRAQMTMLPRLKPRNFYDLVIQVAIVRPGPIQGDMVHPYLRRREGRERVSFPSDALAGVLGKTLGVPLFQEQAMRIAIVAAGFSPADADRLRRAMATFRKSGIIHAFGDKLVEGMVGNGYDRDFAARCFKQIEGFGTYGFPESHAASFALLVYVSSWLKCHHPDVFAAALLNSQPMGFYAPAQIVRDAAEHGVVVHPPDVNASDWDCTLEDRDAQDGRHALRLGLRMAKGLSEEVGRRVAAARPPGGYRDPHDLWRRAGLSGRDLRTLAEADAFRSMGLDRRQALWAVTALADDALPLFAGHDRPPEPAAPLPEMALGEHVVEDYARLRLSLKAHPMALLRDAVGAGAGAAPRTPFPPNPARHPRHMPTGLLPDRPAAAGAAGRPVALVRAAALAHLPHGRRVWVAGLVLVRQRPGSAKGVVFITLEDETGVANLVVLPPAFETFRKEILAARLLLCHGRVERQDLVVHVRVERLVDVSHLLRGLLDEPATVRRMDAALAPADEVRRPTPDQRDVAAAKRRFPDGRNFR
jgi:error-prone DNA polymerase